MYIHSTTNGTQLNSDLCYCLTKT